MHFAPTLRAKQNLLNEGIRGESIHYVGNTIVQAAEMGASRFNAIRDTIPTEELELIDTLKTTLADSRIILITTHRRENHEMGIQSIASAALDILNTYSDVHIVWPVHPNPKVMRIVEDVFGQLSPLQKKRLHVTKPLLYPVLLWILKHAWVVCTDSGGIQEEAVALHTPVLVLRKTTERQENY